MNKLTLVLTFFLILPGNIYGQEDPDLLFERGYNYLTSDRLQAIKLLTRCIEADPGYVKAYYHRGIAFFKDGDYDKALEDFNKAQELAPELGILWMYKGFSYRNMGDLDKALASFSNYISKNPTDTTAYSYILRGKMKYELGDFQGAVKDYEMAIQLKPFEEKYQYYRFIALYDDAQYVNALQAVNRLTEINPGFYGYYYYKGNIFQQLEQYDSAIYMYNIAIFKNSRNSDSYFQRAKAYFQIGNPERALEDFNAAIQRDSSDPSYYAERGNCKFVLNDNEGACVDWRQANNMGYYEDFSAFQMRCQ